jgi:hypothetical protein
MAGFQWQRREGIATRQQSTIEGTYKRRISAKMNDLLLLSSLSGHLFRTSGCPFFHLQKLKWHGLD